jgi:hypothetical protein
MPVGRKEQRIEQSPLIDTTRWPPYANPDR